MKTEARLSFPTAGCAESRTRDAASRFEAEWRPDQPMERFDDHLPPPGDRSRSYVLRELVVRDLELRLVNDLPARAEDYLDRFPELRENRSAVLELLRAEYENRRLAEPLLGLDEFRRRFPDHADVLGTRIAGLPFVPGYDVLGEVGRGGMGVVYRARQQSLNRLVALKFIQDVGWALPQLQQRFRTEAEAAAHLQHPNVVQIHAIGEHDGRSYLAMEYCVGGSLAERLTGTPWPPDRAAELVETLARAVQFAHDRGIIHRDLKPGNILLTEAREQEVAVGGRRVDRDSMASADFSVLTPKIADFGLAKKLDDPAQTSTGSVIGTPSYMAPEQASPAFGTVGPAADVYALGTILYELLTGRPPFRAGSKWDTVQQVLREEPVSPRRLNPTVDRRLETVCLKCLRKEPAGRYGSAQALADDLRRFRAGQPVQARPAGLLEHGWRWCRRQPVTAGLAAGLLVVALASGAVIVQQWWQAVTLAHEERAARQRAEDNFAIARQLVSELASVGAGPLAVEFDVQREQQRQALQKAEAYCRRLLQDPQSSAEVRMTLAQVYEGLSGLHRSLGDVHAAEQAAGRAVAEWQRLEGEDLSCVRGLIRARRQLALQYSNRGDLLLALKELRQAHTRLQAYAAVGSGLELERNDVMFDLAACLEGTGERAEAQALYAESHAFLTQLIRAGYSPSELRPRLAATCWNEGTLLELLGRPREALPYWRQARTLYRELVAEGPHPRQSFRLAQCCAALARNQAGSATDYAEALRLLEDAGRQLDHLAAQDPAIAEELGDTYYYLALWHQAAGEDRPALAACQIGVRHSETAMRRHPLDPNCTGRWLRALGLLARLQDRAGDAADAAVTHHQLRAGIQRLTHVASDQRQSRVLVAWQLAKLSPDLRQSGNTAEALDAAQACRRLYDELVAEAPVEASLQAGLANAWVQVAKCHWRLVNHEQVLVACQQALIVQRRLFEQAPQVLEYRALLDDRHIRLERILGHLGRLDEVRDSILEREKLWLNNPARLRTLADALNKLADEASAFGSQDPRSHDYRTEAARLARKADELGCQVGGQR